MGADGEVTIFADTNIGTRIAFNAPTDTIVASLKRDFEKAHFTCLPDIGEIQVNGLMVKRKSCFYYLPDSLPIKYVFPPMRGTWFLHVEVMHLKCLHIPCSPCDEAVLSKSKDLQTCNGEGKARCNSEEKKTDGLPPRSCLVEEQETTNHVSKKQKEKGISHETHAQNAATGMSERYPVRFGDKSMDGLQPRSCLVEEHETTNHVSKKQKEKGISHETHAQNAATGISGGYPVRFGDKPTSTANKSSYIKPESKVENLVELHTNSMQGSLSKMSTQVVSVTGIINKYFSGFNGIDNDSSSSNSDVTSKAVHGEVEVQSNPRKRSCSKRESDSLPQFTPKTPPNVLTAPLHVDLVSKKSWGKIRKSKVRKRLPSESRNRESKIGKRLVVALQNLGVSTMKHDPTLSFRRFKDRRVLQDKSQTKGSIFSISDSDD